VFYCDHTDSDAAASQGEAGKVGKNSKQHIGFRMGSLQSTGSGLIGTGHALSGMHPDTSIRAQSNFQLFCFYVLPSVLLSLSDSCTCYLLHILHLRGDCRPDVNALLDDAPSFDALNFLQYIDALPIACLTHPLTVCCLCHCTVSTESHLIASATVS